MKKYLTPTRGMIAVLIVLTLLNIYLNLSILDKLSIEALNGNGERIHISLQKALVQIQQANDVIIKKLNESKSN